MGRGEGGLILSLSNEKRKKEGKERREGKEERKERKKALSVLTPLPHNRLSLSHPFKKHISLQSQYLAPPFFCLLACHISYASRAKEEEGKKKKLKCVGGIPGRRGGRSDYWDPARGWDCHRGRDRERCAAEE